MSNDVLLHRFKLSHGTNDGFVTIEHHNVIIYAVSGYSRSRSLASFLVFTPSSCTIAAVSWRDLGMLYPSLVPGSKLRLKCHFH